MSVLLTPAAHLPPMDGGVLIPPQSSANRSPRVIPPKAYDKLFGGNKYHQRGVSSSSNPSATSSPTLSPSPPPDHSPSDVSHPHHPDRQKILDKLGLTEKQLDKFESAPRAFAKLGADPSLQFHGAADRGAIGAAILAKQRAEEEEALKAAQAAQEAESIELHRVKFPIPQKAQDFFFGGTKKSNKMLDRLGISQKEMDQFKAQPKAFQKLGMFQEADGHILIAQMTRARLHPTTAHTQTHTQTAAAAAAAAHTNMDTSSHQSGTPEAETKAEQQSFPSDAHVNLFSHKPKQLEKLGLTTAEMHAFQDKQKAYRVLGAYDTKSNRQVITQALKQDGYIPNAAIAANKSPRTHNAAANNSPNRSARPNTKTHQRGPSSQSSNRVNQANGLITSNPQMNTNNGLLHNHPNVFNANPLPGFGSTLAPPRPLTSSSQSLPTSPFGVSTNPTLSQSPSQPLLPLPRKAWGLSKSLAAVAAASAFAANKQTLGHSASQPYLPSQSMLQQNHTNTQTTNSVHRSNLETEEGQQTESHLPTPSAFSAQLRFAGAIGRVMKDVHHQHELVEQGQGAGAQTDPSYFNLSSSMVANGGPATAPNKLSRAASRERLGLSSIVSAAVRSNKKQKQSQQYGGLSVAGQGVRRGVAPAHVSMNVAGMDGFGIAGAAISFNNKQSHQQTQGTTTPPANVLNPIRGKTSNKSKGADAAKRYLSTAKAASRMSRSGSNPKLFINSDEANGNNNSNPRSSPSGSPSNENSRKLTSPKGKMTSPKGSNLTSPKGMGTSKLTSPKGSPSSNTKPGSK